MTTVAGPASLASGGNTASIACGLTATTIADGGDGSDARAGTTAMPCLLTSSSRVAGEVRFLNDDVA